MGDRVIQIDDDLSGLVVALDKTTARDVLDLVGLFDRAFELTAKSKAHLWGLYPARNPYFMRQRVRLDLTYIGGGLFGTIHRGTTESETELVLLDDKEDFERSLRFYYRDGVVVRLESISWKTVGYAGAGGMQLTRTKRRALEGSEFLARRYTDFCKLNLTKRSGWAEVRLRDPRTRSITTPIDLSHFATRRTP